MAVLDVRGLCVKYSTSNGAVYAVEDADFDLLDGESLGIAGESACGKSTMGLAVIRMLLGGEVKGRVTLDGQSLLDMDESKFDSKYRWKEISMMFQGAMNSLDPVFTIKDQFTEILQRHGFDEDFGDAISDAVKAVRLDPAVLKKYPHELSGGMKQRVVIAMALLLKPSIVIADEPTTALDVLIQAQIVNLLKSLKKQGVEFILITHDLAVLSEIADKVAVMYGGHIVEFGTSEEVYRNPRHPYTQGLLQSIPRLRGERPKSIPGIPPSLLEAPTACRFIERCPLAVEKCKKVPPKFETPTGYVRCWLEEEKDAPAPTPE